MLHDKEITILSEFLGDYNKKIYGRELGKKLTFSQKNVALLLEKLERKSILKSKKLGNIKHYSLNFKNSEIKDYLLLAEVSRKIGFMKKHRKVANIFQEDTRIVGIFGSYTKGYETKKSDLDLFIIGKKQTEDYEQTAKIFDLKISAKYFTEKEFIKLLKEKNNLIKEIIKNHVLIFGFEKFIKLIWRKFYGLN